MPKVENPINLNDIDKKESAKKEMIEIKGNIAENETLILSPNELTDIDHSPANEQLINSTNNTNSIILKHSYCDSSHKEKIITVEIAPSALMDPQIDLNKIENKVIPKIVSVILDYNKDLQPLSIYELNDSFAEVETNGKLLKVYYQQQEKKQEISETCQVANEMFLEAKKSNAIKGNNQALALVQSTNTLSKEIPVKALTDLDSNAFETRGQSIEIVNKNGKKLIFTNTTTDFNESYGVYAVEGLGAEMHLKRGSLTSPSLFLQSIISTKQNGIGRHMIDIACHFALCNKKKTIVLEAAYGSWPFYFLMGFRPKQVNKLSIDNKMCDMMLVWHAKIFGLLSDEENRMLAEIAQRCGKDIWLVQDEDMDLYADEDTVFTKTFSKKDLESARELNNLSSGDKYPFFEVGTIVSPVTTKLVLENSGLRRNEGEQVGMFLDAESLLEWQKRAKEKGIPQSSLILELGGEKLASDLADLRRRLRVLNEKYFGNKYQV